tara:strand:- start:131 stop:412 length:282 start_codon:yes stop_codon:yes gene_type:complete
MELLTIVRKLTRTINISGFSIAVNSIELGKSANLMISLYSADDVLEPDGIRRIRGITSYQLEGEEYTNWGADDRYLVELIKEKIDLIIERAGI